MPWVTTMFLSQLATLQPHLARNICWCRQKALGSSCSVYKVHMPQAHRNILRHCLTHWMRDMLVQCRLDTGKELLWFECGRKVSPAMCGMAQQWFLHFCSCSSWHCHRVPCWNNQGQSRHMLTVHLIVMTLIAFQLRSSYAYTELLHAD